MTDNPERQRYEVRVDGELAGFAEYRMRPSGMALTHTEVLPEFGGKGVGTVLAEGMLGALRAAGQKIIPICPFLVSFIKRHPEYQDLVVPRDQRTEAGA